LAVNPFGWLVIVVFVLIWILNSFLRSGEEQKNANRRRNAGGRPDGGGRRKTEIEEFLEEVNRRRRQKTDQTSPTAEEAAPSMRTPLATRTTRPTTSVRPEPRRQKPAARPTRTVSQREIEQPVLAEAVVVMEEPPLSTVGQAKLGQLTSVPERPAAAVQLTTMAPEIKAAPLAELTALLTSTEGMRAAMILQEVLGPPRCKQQGHRS
jgi:hypothetical protein